jgi:hypothetical protein
LGVVKQNKKIFLIVQVQVGMVSVAVTQGGEKVSEKKIAFPLARFHGFQYLVPVSQPQHIAERKTLWQLTWKIATFRLVSNRLGTA